MTHQTARQSLRTCPASAAARICASQTCRCWGGSTVQVTADFYNANPFFDNSGGEIRYARKVYMLEFYSTGVLFHSARFMPLSEDDLRAALQLHTGETTDDLAQLFWTYDSQNRNLLGSLPSGDWTALPLTEDAWDGLSLFVYERYARENNWPLTISETDFDHTLVRYFPLGRYGWEDRSSLYLTYEDGTYTRTINDNHGARYCYLKRISCMTDGSFQLVFRCLDVPELTEYADASADVRAVYDHAGVTEMQPAEFRAAVYRAFADGVIPPRNRHDGADRDCPPDRRSAVSVPVPVGQGWITRAGFSAASLMVSCKAA